MKANCDACRHDYTETHSGRRVCYPARARDDVNDWAVTCCTPEGVPREDAPPCPGFAPREAPTETVGIDIPAGLYVRDDVLARLAALLGVPEDGVVARVEALLGVAKEAAIMDARLWSRHAYVIGWPLYSAAEADALSRALAGLRVAE